MFDPIAIIYAFHLVAASSNGGAPLWQTAVIAAGSAVTGAFVGGYVSYRGNLRLSNAQRRMRAAVRRKAKVYVPLKLELTQLSAAIDSDLHVNWGIDTTDDPNRHAQMPTFAMWGKLVDDGRASSAVSNAVRTRMEVLAEAVMQFRLVRAASGETFQDVGQPLYRELSGQPQFRTGLGSYAMADPLWNRETPWHDWEHSGSSGFDEFRDRFNQSHDVQQARSALLHANAVLTTVLAQALGALDDGIARIAKREEKESPED